MNEKRIDELAKELFAGEGTMPEIRAALETCAREAAEEEREKLKVAEEALVEWANLIEFQYSGAREAMNALVYADRRGQEALAAIRKD